MAPPPRSRRRPTLSNPLPGRPLVLEHLEDRTVPSTSTLQTVLGNLSYDPNLVSRSSILVGFHDTQADYTNYSAASGTRVATKLDLLPGYYIVQVSGESTVEQALQAYAATNLVAEVSPDYLLSSAATPNDTRYSEQWALSNSSGGSLNAAAAWDVTTGSRKTVISVMDTGVDYNHTDLYRNIWINQEEIPASRRSKLVDIDGDGLITFNDLNDSRNQGTGKITDQNGDGRISAEDILAPLKKDSSGKDTGLGGWADGISNNGDRFVDDLVGWNFVNDTNRPMDDNNHGTHVAGIIGAEGNNATGISGVSWVSQVMAIKFMNSSGKGSIGSFIAGLDYAVARGAKISNNSWAGGTFTTLLYDAITNARARGHIFVAAAGNNATNLDNNPSYPASYDVDNVVVVGSSSRTDTHSSFSNFGVATVDVSAPGEGILSTLPGNRYGVMSGTSMAAPQVTGTIALIWARNPTWSYKQVIDRLLSTVDKRSALASRVATGGRVNAATAVGATVNGAVTTAPKVVSSTATGVETNTLNKITVTFSESLDASTMKASAVKLIGPSGKAISLTGVKAVSGSSNKKWDLTFLTQNTPGSYSLQLTNAIKDTQGTALVNYYTTFTIAKTATYSNTQSSSILDTKTITSTIKVNQNAKVQSLTVKVNLSHSYMGDLALYLVAPNGQKVTLAYRRGGSGNGFTNTVFTDSTSQSVTTGRAPFTGNFKPEQALSMLKNVPTLGNWRLQVQDLARGDVGTLLNWSMTITTTNGQTLSTQSSGQAATIQGFSEETEESAIIDPPTPGTYTVTVSGPPLTGTQVVTPLGSSWLSRELSEPASRPAAPSQPQPQAEPSTPLPEDWTVSDLLFQQVNTAPNEEEQRSVVYATPSGTARSLEEVLSDFVLS